MRKSDTDVATKRVSSGELGTDVRSDNLPRPFHHHHSFRQHQGSTIDEVGDVISAAVTASQARRSSQQFDEDGNPIKVTPVLFIISPKASFVMYWDLVLTVALCFISLVTPVEVALFDNEWETVMKGEAVALFMINRLIDVAFVCDMAMQFFLSYYDVKTGLEVSLCNGVWRVSQKVLA